MTTYTVKLYDLEKQPDGSVSVKSVLTPEEMLFMLEFALINLLNMGVAPNSVATEVKRQAEENKDDEEALDLLKKLPDDKFHKA